MSRLQAMQDKGIAPEFPPLDAPAYLLDLFWEIGPVLSGAMGSGELTHGELDAWQRNTGVRLDSWESRTLKQLSRDYLSALHQAAKRDCPPPWQPEQASAAHLNQVANEMMEAMRKLAAM